MARYRVKPGFVHGLKSEYKAGDTLDLEPQAAAGFADKLELVEVEPVLAVEQSTEAPAGEVVPLIVAVPVFGVTASTVAEVLAAVANGLITPAAALEIETANRNRATLVKALQELIGGTDGE